MERAQIGLLLPDLAATRALGARLGACLASGSVVLLTGDLGAGKSELARAVIRGLAGTNIAVPSPTFTLLQSYELPGLEVTHSDLYRIGDVSEIDEIGLEECWQRGAVLVEWPDRAPWLWPAERLTVTLDLLPDHTAGARQVALEGTGRWAALLPNLAGGQQYR